MSTHRIRRVTLALGALVAAAIIGAWWNLRPSTSDRGAASSPPDLPATRTAIATGLVSSSSEHPGIDPDAPLLGAWPMNRQPITERWALLEPRAVRGDAVAACRLGIELVECERRRQNDGHLARATRTGAQTDLDLLVGLPSHVADWEREAARAAEERRREAPPEAREHWAENARRTAEARVEGVSMCDGLDDAKASAGIRWLRQAALAGQADAQVAYLAFHRRWQGRPGAFRDPEFAAWRTTAPVIAERLLARGDTRAPHMIAELYRDVGGAGALLRRDPLRALAAERVREWLIRGASRETLHHPTYGEPALDRTSGAKVTELALAMARPYPDRTAPARDVWDMPEIGLPGHDCGLSPHR